MVKCLTYSSYATVGLQPSDLEAILMVSRRNNIVRDLTGVLMFNGAIFVQTIEGPQDAVDGLMRQIVADFRHCHVEVRDTRTSRKRIFPDWTMGYVRLDDGWLQGQCNVADALSRSMPQLVRQILTSLATTLPFD